MSKAAGRAQLEPTERGPKKKSQRGEKKKKVKKEVFEED